jgi:uncharacterized Zn finger protein
VLDHEERTEDDTWTCGVSYDHTVEVVAEADGVQTLECTNCGAEWADEEDDWEADDVD